MKPIPPNAIEVGDIVIVVQACCDEWANIAVLYKDPYIRHQRGGQVQHRVSLPNFTREWHRYIAWEMSPKIYDKFLQENKQEILDLIDRLNTCPPEQLSK